jgi:hypothetical protein
VRFQRARDEASIGAVIVIAKDTEDSNSPSNTTQGLLFSAAWNQLLNGDTVT